MVGILGTLSDVHADCLSVACVHTSSLRGRPGAVCRAAIAGSEQRPELAPGVAHHGH